MFYPGRVIITQRVPSGVWDTDTGDDDACTIFSFPAIVFRGHRRE